MRFGRAAFRHVAAERGLALGDVGGLAAVARGSVERRANDFGVGEGDREAVAELEQFALVEFLLLVGDVASLAGFAEPVALDRAGEDHCRCAAVVDGCVIGGVDLERVVSAKPHAPELVVGDVVDHAQESRVDAPEVFADVAAAGDGVLLVLAVDDFAHALHEEALVVAGEEAVPLGAPDDLDHVPADAAEDGFEFLDDLSVAAHWAVEPLEVAVDDEDEIVEFFSGGEGDGAERFGLVGLAVAEEAPDFAVGGFEQVAVFEVADEAGEIDGLDRAESHGDGGELPVVVHEPGMGVGGESTGEFLAELVQAVGLEAALDITAGVDAGRGVSLEVDQVAAGGVVLSAEEVVEADLVEGGGGGVGGDVSADAVVVLVGLDDHRHGVPADDGFDAALDVEVAGIGGLALDGDRVDVRRLRSNGQSDAGALGFDLQGLQEPRDAFGAAASGDVAEGVEPVVGFEPILGAGGFGVACESRLPGR